MNGCTTRHNTPPDTPHFTGTGSVKTGSKPDEICEHEGLLALPVVSGHTLREHQPPTIPEFESIFTDWTNLFSIQETSGTSGMP